MCGIAGAFLDSSLGPEIIEKMVDASSHRGPDDNGCETFSLKYGLLALGHNRLAIRDLSTAGHQPMYDTRNGNVLIFNGEIYNYQVLRAELEAMGVSFKSSSDTEIILHAYAHWGTDCFGRFDGMFSIGLYDKIKGRVILCRDPLGIKPLYYSYGDFGFLFASELRTLMASGLIKKAIDFQGLASYLAYGAVQQPTSMFQGVHQLPPGCWTELSLSVMPKQASLKPAFRYWRFPKVKNAYELDYNEEVKSLRNLLITSIKSHLASDVPVGLFLSGGIDSNILAAVIASESQENVHAFTIGFSEEHEFDEIVDAKKASDHFGLNHSIIKVTPKQALIHAQNFLKALDQPTIDGLNTYILSSVVHDHGIKVALSGLGADELFGGYPSFVDVPKIMQVLKFSSYVPPALRRLAATLIYSGKNSVKRNKAVEFASTLPRVRNVYARRRRLFSDFELNAFGLMHGTLGLDNDYLSDENFSNYVCDEHEIISSVSILESTLYMGNMLLRDTDVFGMAHGLEIRVPFLDRSLIDNVYSLPGDWRKPRMAQNKPLLTDAMKIYLKEYSLNRPKRGFKLPQAEWMRGPLRSLFDNNIQVLMETGLLNPEVVQTVWRTFLNDGSGSTWSRAWSLGVLGAWMHENY